MKRLVPFAVIAISAATLPALLASGDAPPVNASCTAPANVSRVLATIRHIESGDNYTARAHGSTASGAYQFLDSSWSHYGGYPSAWMAPPTVQDAKATENVRHILAAHNNDPSAVPVSWYIGYVPAAGSPAWDTVPYPSAGNRLTPRQYQTLWMHTYDRTTPDQPASCVTDIRVGTIGLNESPPTSSRRLLAIDLLQAFLPTVQRSCVAQRLEPFARLDPFDVLSDDRGLA